MAGTNNTTNAAKQKLRAKFGKSEVQDTSESEFVAETHWLNVGFEDDEGNFISLNLGIPVSKLKPVKVPPQGEYRQIALMRNALIKKISDVAQACTNGEEIALDGLEVRLRAVADQEPTDNDADIALPFAINWGSK